MYDALIETLEQVEGVDPVVRGGGFITVESVANEDSEPLPGDVRSYDWVDSGTLVVEVEFDGNLYYETYSHDSTEAADEVPGSQVVSEE